ncbi:MAG TPA: hypothetical protein PK442_10725 [Synergistales bacterium]|jgi:hypothetical protein|nr:hypothetical protein [Synergistales bacterium]
MAQFVPLRCRVNFRLLAGSNPETGRDIIRTVSVTRTDPSLTPAALKEVETLLSPMFEYPVVEVQRALTDLVEDI